MTYKKKSKVKQCTYRDFRTRYVEDLFTVRYSVRGSNSEALRFHPKSKLGIFGTCLFLSFEDLEDTIVFPTRHCFGLGTVSISLERPGLESVVHISFGAVPSSRWRRRRRRKGFCSSRGPRRRMPCVMPFGLHGLSSPHSACLEKNGRQTLTLWDSKGRVLLAPSAARADPTLEWRTQWQTTLLGRSPRAPLCFALLLKGPASLLQD